MERRFATGFGILRAICHAELQAGCKPALRKSEPRDIEFTSASGSLILLYGIDG